MVFSARALFFIVQFYVVIFGLRAGVAEHFHKFGVDHLIAPILT